MAEGKEEILDKNMGGLRYRELKSGFMYFTAHTVLFGKLAERMRAAQRRFLMRHLLEQDSFSSISPFWPGLRDDPLEAVTDGLNLKQARLFHLPCLQPLSLFL